MKLFVVTGLTPEKVVFERWIVESWNDAQALSKVRDWLEYVKETEGADHSDLKLSCVELEWDDCVEGVYCVGFNI